MANSKPCFSNLPDDMIVEIFNHLPTKKLLATESVSRTWKRCVDKSLNRVEILAFDWPYLFDYDAKRCQHLRQVNFRQTLVVKQEIHGSSCSLISSNRLDSMMPVLKRCRQIKCLWLDAAKNDCDYDDSDFDDYPGDPYIEFNDIETFMKLLDVLPKLECFYYGKFKINKRFYDYKWMMLCKKVGARIKHLTLDRIKSLKFDSLITDSAGLEFIYFKSIYDKNAMVHYLGLLRNRQSIHLAIEFTYLGADSSLLDADTAAVISCAHNLTTELFYLNSVAKYCLNFDRLKALVVKNHPEDIIEHCNMNFPVLEDLVFLDFEYLDQTTIIHHMKVFNLSGLKSLKMKFLDNDLLEMLAGKMTSLKKLVSNSTGDRLPTDSLLLLESIEYLNINHRINSVDHLTNVVRLFEILTQMRWLKRCRVTIKKSDGFYINRILTDLYYQLNQTEADLRESLPFVEIDFPLDDWFITHTGRTPSYSDEEEYAGRTSYSDKEDYDYSSDEFDLYNLTCII